MITYPGMGNTLEGAVPDLCNIIRESRKATPVAVKRDKMGTQHLANMARGKGRGSEETSGHAILADEVLVGDPSQEGGRFSVSLQP